MKSLSHVWLFATPWTGAYQSPLSMGFSRQGYWSGLPFPSPEVLPDPGSEAGSPILQAYALPSTSYQMCSIWCSVDQGGRDTMHACFLFDQRMPGGSFLSWRRGKILGRCISLALEESLNWDQRIKGKKWYQFWKPGLALALTPTPYFVWAIH